MVAQGSGRKIINIASMLSFKGGINVSISYTAAKSGVAGVTCALANEWAKHGINVNTIAPGYMATDNTAPLRADPVRTAAILERIPLGRAGAPRLTWTAWWCSWRRPRRTICAVQVVPVDGGWLAR